MRHKAVGALLVVVASSGYGAELVVRDLVTRFEVLPTAFTYTVDNASFSASGSDAFRSSFGMVLGGRYSLAGPGRSWGPIVGIDLAFADQRNDGAKLRSAELRGVAGLAWQMSNEVVWFAQLAVGSGYGRISFDQSGGTSSGMSGSLMPGAAMWWRIGERTHLTLDAGWRQYSARLHQGDTAVDLRQAAPYLAIGMTWGLSRAPWSLE